MGGDRSSEVAVSGGSTVHVFTTVNSVYAAKTGQNKGIVHVHL